MVLDPALETDNATKVDWQYSMVDSKHILPQRCYGKINNNESDKIWRRPVDGGEASEFTIDRLVDYNKETQKFCIRWFSYADAADTWQ